MRFDDYTEYFNRIIFEDERRVLVFDHLNDRDCWLPKFYTDGRPIIQVERLTNGVEITMPEWLAKDRELI